MKEVVLQAEIDKDTLIDCMCSRCSNDELFDFIKELDLRVADWEFTLKLAGYFNDRRRSTKKRWKSDFN